MRSQIKRLLTQHGELTFRELCAALNCYTQAEVDDVRGYARAYSDPIGEAPIHASTILRKKLVDPPAVPRTQISDMQAMLSW